MTNIRYGSLLAGPLPHAGGMKAQAGDRIRIPSASGQTRDGEIVAVCGRERGEPPFAVRFGDGRVRLVIPDRNAVIEHRLMSELEG